MSFDNITSICDRRTTWFDDRSFNYLCGWNRVDRQRVKNSGRRWNRIDRKNSSSSFLSMSFFGRFIGKRFKLLFNNMVYFFDYSHSCLDCWVDMIVVVHKKKFFSLTSKTSVTVVFAFAFTKFFLDKLVFAINFYLKKDRKCFILTFWRHFTTGSNN